MTPEQIYQDYLAKQKAYTDYAAGAQGFQEALKSQYNTKYNNNADLITQQNAAQNQLYQLPTTMRANYLSGPVRNPLEQEALIGQRVGNAQQNVQNVSDLLSQRGMKYQDMLNSAIGQYSSQTDANRLSAEAAWQQYVQAQAQREADRQYALQVEALRRSGSGGGGGGYGYGYGDVGGAGGGDELTIEVPDAGGKKGKGYSSDTAEGYGTLASKTIPKGTTQDLELMYKKGTKSKKIGDKMNASLALYANLLLKKQQQQRLAQEQAKGGKYWEAFKSALKASIPS